ncbi:MAG: protein-glutamate O-methyltransferase CheR [Actinomycetota bacterium]
MSTPTKAGTGKEELSISTQSFDFFQKLIYDRIGVQLDGKAYLVESRLQPMLRKHKVSDVNALIDKIKGGDRPLTEEAVEAMTTNETSFFRDIHPFETLAKEVLPPIFAQKGGDKVRIWNGACSSGQESYTLAIVLHEHFRSQVQSGRIEIISTDVSPEMVKRTRDGIYSRFEINRGLPPEMSNKYFDTQGRQWQAKASLRDMIKTSELNLLSKWNDIPRCDLVLLRNVLIYFSPQTKAEILRKIRTDVLLPGGCLMLGASESTAGIDSAYQSRKVGKTVLYYP